MSSNVNGFDTRSFPNASNVFSTALSNTVIDVVWVKLELSWVLNRAVRLNDAGSEADVYEIL